MEYIRIARRALTDAFRTLPIVSVLGPRQSGKTTLCRSAFPDATYINLEDPGVRGRAAEDLSGFVSAIKVPAILDEVQRLPEILSAVQVESDRRNVSGQYIITGSQQFNLSESISQSLAGRTAIIKLLPLSLEERLLSNDSPKIYDTMLSGGYPRIISGGLNPSATLGDYIETYVERDVRQLTNVRDLQTFRTFLRLVAGRVGQLVNYESLAGDAGISAKTAHHWLSILETGFISFALPPYFRNVSKRLIRTPKIYFYDTGLCAALLGIQSIDQLDTHPLRGGLFENLIISEVKKFLWNRALRNELFFYRDRSKLELDLLVENGASLLGAEIKSSSTYSNSFSESVKKVSSLLTGLTASAVVFNNSSPTLETQPAMIGPSSLHTWLATTLDAAR